MGQNVYVENKQQGFGILLWARLVYILQNYVVRFLQLVLTFPLASRSATITELFKKKKNCWEEVRRPKLSVVYRCCIIWRNAYDTLSYFAGKWLIHGFNCCVESNGFPGSDHVMSVRLF